MPEIDLLYLGVFVGIVPFIVTFFLGKTEFISIWKKFFYGKKACKVILIMANKQIDTVIAKFEGGKTIHMKKKDIEFDPEEMGLDGRTASLLMYEDGRQVKLTDLGVNVPLTAKQYNDSIMDALLVGADNMIIKTLKSIKLFVLIGLAAIGITAFLTWQLVEKLL